MVSHLPTVKRVVDSVDQGGSYTRLIPSLLAESQESRTYETSANSETGDWRKDGTLRNSAPLPKETRGLCATGVPLSTTTNSETGDGNTRDGKRRMPECPFGNTSG